MLFRVLKPLSCLHDDRLYMPGEIFDDQGALDPYQIDLIQAMGVIEPLADTPAADEEP